MAEFWWIRVCLCVILVIQFTATTDQHPSSFVVRAGDEVTLPCKNRTNDGRRCDGITWAFSRFPKAAAEDLIVLGQIKSSRSKSNRLSVTANCSLVIKKVTGKVGGRYFCQQSNKSGKKETQHTLDLSVINMNEQKDDDKVTLSCSLSSYKQCRHTVKWLYEGKDVDKDNKDLKTSQSGCSAKVTFGSSHFIYESLKCNVTDKKSGNVQLFTFSPRKTGKHKRAPVDKDATRTPKEQRWVFTVVAVGSAALLITVLLLVRWKRNKGNQTQMDENMADPEDVSYASIRHTTKRNSKAQVRGGDETVIYATVKASSSSSSSSSAGASADPCNVYATIN